MGRSALLRFGGTGEAPVTTPMVALPSLAHEAVLRLPICNRW